MRKNAPRKWIHAILDLLPLLVIPIFAIYTRNESNTFENNIELQVEQNKVVDFNQLFKNGNFEDNTYYSVSNGTMSVSNNELNISNINTGSIFQVYVNQYYTCNYGDKLYVKYSYNCNELNNFSGTAPTIVYNQSTYLSLAFNTNAIGTYSSIFTFNQNSNYTFRFLLSFNNFNSLNLSGNVLSISNLQFFNLTTMFGSGNEPTLEQFNQWYPNDYYDYTLSEKQLIKNYSVEILNNTDIGSQFLYSVYKPVNDYFNFNNLFNMQGIYDWLQLNLFGGNAPLPVLIVWNIIVYEFFIDLIFLLYSVFMFIIDWSTSMLDKFLYKSRN